MVRQFRYRQRSRRVVLSLHGASLHCAARNAPLRIGISVVRELPMCRPTVLRPAALRARSADERVAAIADPGTVAPVNDLLAAPRRSPHLASWRIRAQDNDGVVTARATIDGAPILIAAQDERFLGGSAGANHADALRALFHAARRERPAAVVLLVASGGVRLHGAPPARDEARALGARGHRVDARSERARRRRSGGCGCTLRRRGARGSGRGRARRR